MALSDNEIVGQLYRQSVQMQERFSEELQELQLKISRLEQEIEMKNQLISQMQGVKSEIQPEATDS